MSATQGDWRLLEAAEVAGRTGINGILTPPTQATVHAGGGSVSASVSRSAASTSRFARLRRLFDSHQAHIQGYGPANAAALLISRLVEPAAFLFELCGFDCFFLRLNVRPIALSHREFRFESSLYGFIHTQKLKRKNVPFNRRGSPSTHLQRLCGEEKLGEGCAGLW
jgi:hypothetical protein